MNPETPIMHQIMLDCGHGDTRLFRQQSCMAWAGKARRVSKVETVKMAPGDVLIRGAFPIRFGVPGMSDLGGRQTVVVTPGMVGKRIAVYVAIEVKTPDGIVEDDQARFIAEAIEAGALAGVARSVRDAANILAGTPGGTAEPTNGAHPRRPPA